jgi:ectoine hydroxylase-related dioxygenase (phytanoyl-CoA dioxygenase family)
MGNANCRVGPLSASSIMGSPLRKQNRSWVKDVLGGLRSIGYAVVEDVLGASFIQTTRDAMYRAREEILRDVGQARLVRAGEMGVLRLMMKYDPHFFRFLEIPELLEIIDNTVLETAIMHLQNGFILSSYPEEQSTTFQSSFHQDFPRDLNGYVASINIMFAIDEFSTKNGATLVVPGSHKKASVPDMEDFEENAIAIECPAGSMVVFDSTLWHAAGANTSGKDRLAINHQFTRSYIKQQIDYVRALGDETVLLQKPRTQQLLGWYTRVVTSLDEYYRPEHERLYRKGQG